MDDMTASSGVAGEWTSRAVDLVRRVGATQAEGIATAARWCADAIEAGGMAHMFGSGHSRMAVEEMFPRYGSYPGFNPLVELSMTFHTQVVGSNGQRQAMFVERTPGLAAAVLDNYAFLASDVMLVFSVSGTSTVPVEIAQGARERGLRTVAITSVRHSEASDAPGRRLKDVADLVIDIGTPPGDALVRVPGLDTPVGPGSTFVTVVVVNEIKVQTAALLVQRGIRPPVITAAAVVGAERSAELFDAAYDEHAVRISAAIGAAAQGRADGTGLRSVAR